MVTNDGFEVYVPYNERQLEVDSSFRIDYHFYLKNVDTLGSNSKLKHESAAVLFLASVGLWVASFQTICSAPAPILFHRAAFP